MAAVYSWESASYPSSPTLPNLEKAVAAFGISMTEFYGPLPELAA